MLTLPNVLKTHWKHETGLAVTSLMKVSHMTMESKIKIALTLQHLYSYPMTMVDLNMVMVNNSVLPKVTTMMIIVKGHTIMQIDYTLTTA